MARKKAQNKEDVEVTKDEFVSEESLNETEMTPEELEEQSKIAQETFTKNQEKEAPASAGVGKMYSEDQVRQMLAQVLKDKDADQPDADAEEAKTVRIPRFQNKFVFAFKNMNTDPYFPDKVIHAFDVYNEQLRANVPWVTLVFEDGSELSVAFGTVLKQSSKVDCELIERKQVDASYDFGKVEKKEVRDGAYNADGTGVFVKAKVTQSRESYVVKLPNGSVVTVAPEVVNW